MNGSAWLRTRLRVCAALLLTVPLALALSLSLPAYALAHDQTSVRPTACPSSGGGSATVSVHGRLYPGFVGLTVPSQLSTVGSDQSDTIVSVTVYSNGAWNLAVSDPDSVQISALAGSGTTSVSVELVDASATVDSTDAHGAPLVFGVVSGY